MYIIATRAQSVDATLPNPWLPASLTLDLGINRHPDHVAGIQGDLPIVPRLEQDVLWLEVGVDELHRVQELDRLNFGVSFCSCRGKSDFVQQHTRTRRSPIGFVCAINQFTPLFVRGPRFFAVTHY